MKQQQLLGCFHQYVNFTFLVFVGLRKDLKNAIKTEGGGDTNRSKLQEWLTAIINHMYWVPTSVCTSLANRADIVEAKWRSLLNHITNKHKHDDPLYPKCQHPKAKRGTKKKKYISKGQNGCRSSPFRMNS